jgi:hypothetical protein
VDDAGYRKIQLSAVLVDKPYPLGLNVGDVAADKFAVVQVLDELP